MTIFFSFSINEAMAHSAAQITARVSAVIPSPVPPDLKLSVSPDSGITITYSVTYSTIIEAAAASLNALKGLRP